MNGSYNATENEYQTCSSSLPPFISQAPISISPKMFVTLILAYIFDAYFSQFHFELLLTQVLELQFFSLTLLRIFSFTYYALPVFPFWCYFDGSLSHEQLPQRYLLILNPRLASPSLALIVRPQRKPADLRASFPHALEATCACYYYIAATATAASWPKNYKYHVRAIAP